MQKTNQNDLTIDEMVRFRKLERAFLSRCRHFGYQEIKTATIQPLHLFTASDALGWAKLHRIYSFIDWNGWSGERVALKPDSTTCVARFYADSNLPAASTMKLCYVENHFEWADAADALSERWQYGIENIGNAQVHADIEAIFMACDILDQIGLKSRHLTLSYPTIVKALVDALDLGANTTQEIIGGIREQRNVSTKIPVETPLGQLLQTLLTGAGENVNYLLNIKSALQAQVLSPIEPALDNFIDICRLLDAMQCRYRIDFSLLGDFDYYSGVQFQILSRPERKAKTDILGAGGRYDNLIANLWKLPEAVPAVGFALYGRNIIDKLPHAVDHLQHIRIIIENINAANISKGQRLCDRLTSLGFEAQLGFEPVPEDQYANFGLVILVDEEIADGYKILNSQKIGKPLLENLFGGLDAQ